MDTNALSAAAEQYPGVREMLSAAKELALPVIVIGEFRYGIAQSRYNGRYQRWLDGLIGDCRVLDVTEQTSHHYATIAVELRKSGTPIPTNDVWIAALCRQHTLSLLSRDRHFDAVAGIERLAW